MPKTATRNGYIFTVISKITLFIGESSLEQVSFQTFSMDDTPLITIDDLYHNKIGAATLNVNALYRGLTVLSERNKQRNVIL